MFTSGNNKNIDMHRLEYCTSHAKSSKGGLKAWEGLCLNIWGLQFHVYNSHFLWMKMVFLNGTFQVKSHAVDARMFVLKLLLMPTGINIISIFCRSWQRWMRSFLAYNLLIIYKALLPDTDLGYSWKRIQLFCYLINSQIVEYENASVTWSIHIINPYDAILSNSWQSVTYCLVFKTG